MIKVSVGKKNRSVAVRVRGEEVESIYHVKGSALGYLKRIQKENDPEPSIHYNPDEGKGFLILKDGTVIDAFESTSNTLKFLEKLLLTWDSQDEMMSAFQYSEIYNLYLKTGVLLKEPIRKSL